MIRPAELLIRTSDFTQSGLGDRSLRRLHEKGIMTRILPGAYVATDEWQRLSPRERYVARVHAGAERLAPSVAVSHWSAAAVWGFPVPKHWPSDLHVIDPSRTTSNRIPSLHRRPGVLEPGDFELWEGLPITTPARTAADLALISSFEDAVLVFDYGLHTEALSIDNVAALLDRRPNARRRRSARAALEFADAGSESPGESYSRVAMAARGFPRPQLQRPFIDAHGKIGHVDFYWEECKLVGEFDGDWKYSDPQFLRGGTPSDAITNEKRRDGRLRAHSKVRDVARWDYTVARNADELCRRLLAAGLVRLNPRTRLSRWS
ncbi:MAG: hypothetical protein JWP75_3181 [Frondihabitans sp.]|nr:hypothetical protein [Frondihabitans sp.]